MTTTIYIILTVLLLGTTLILLYKYNKSLFDSIVYKATLESQKIAKARLEKFGLTHEDWIVNRVWSLTPPFLKFFVDEDTIRTVVKDILYYAEDFVDDGKFNDSVKRG